MLPKVHLLGEPRAVIGKKDHRLQPNRRCQLLAYLAYKQDRISRDALADVFWSQGDSGAARRNLRKVLFEAKNLEWAVGFDHDESGASWKIATDVADFLAAIKDKDWSKAVKVYGGSFLQGLGSDDGAEFDVWLEQERLRLEELYQEASENHVETLERQGKADEAIDFIKGLLARDPLNEILYRQVMRLEFKRGNTELALEQFERCREVLQKELGVEPLPETIELLKTIEQGGGTQAKRVLLLKCPQQIPNLPVNLVGREKLMQETIQLLQKGERVLLHGFGGMGKTALAAFVAKQFLDGKRTAVWLQVGSDNPDVIFDALAQPFEAGQDIAQAEDKTKALQAILQRQKLSLLVLDDVWNAYALSKVMEALPEGLPLLVTSRQRYPKLTKVYVDRLERPASLELLALYAIPLAEMPPLEHSGEENTTENTVGSNPGGVSEGRGGSRSQDSHIANGNPPVLDLQGTKSTSSVGAPSPPHRGGIDEEGANRLCELLGDHPFALRLAGLALQENDATPEGLYEQIKHNPHDFKMPGELREVGRESVASLLSVSLETLEDRAYETFLSYGLLESPVASAGFLASCLGRDVNEIEDALFSLVQRGLAERVSKPGSDLVSYRIHDLAHSYAKVNRFQRLRTLMVAALEYLRKHKDEVEILEMDISNILAAAQIAKERKRENELIDFVYLLTVEGAYYTARGHNRRSAEFLSMAAEMADEKNKLEQAHYLFGKLGDYYQNFLLNFEQAIVCYQKARKLAHEANNQGREAVFLSLIGQVKTRQNKEDAEVYLEQAYQLAKSNKDDLSLCMVLEKRGYVSGLEEKHEWASYFLREALEVIERLRQQSSLSQIEIEQRRFSALLNLGAAENEMGNFVEALTLRQTALKTAKEVGNEMWIAYAHYEIGDMYHNAREHELAKENMHKALLLFEKNDALKDAEFARTFMKDCGYMVEEQVGA